MTPNQSLSLLYSTLGVRILPCRESDGGNANVKAPYISGGFRNATADQAAIRSWWSYWPGAVVGLPCRSNGIIAIDADRHGQVDGVAAVLDLMSINGFNPNSVPIVSTPRDGRHFLFRRPATLSNTNGKIATGIDVRDNAYVIAAGSVMANGRCYSLQGGTPEQLAVAIRNGTLPELPRWLAPMITKHVPTISARHPSQFVTRNGDVERRLAGLVRKVALAQEGERNAILYWAACRADELATEGFIQGEAAVALLTEAGRQAGLSEREAAATTRSGLRMGNGSASRGR